MQDNKIFAFDLETTGVDIATARIVEIGYAIIGADMGVVAKNASRINPCVTIPKEASDVHGICDDDVANKPKFAQVARAIASHIAGCDYILTFNGDSYDVPLLIAEFNRIGQPSPFSEKHKFIDALSIERSLVRFTLSDVYLRRVGVSMQNAHSALDDVLATVAIFEAQMNDSDFGSDGYKKNLDMQRFSKIAKNGDGDAVFRMGKHNGRRVLDVITTDKSYWEWFRKNMRLNIHEQLLLDKTK